MTQKSASKGLNFILILRDFARSFSWAAVRLFSAPPKIPLQNNNLNAGRFEVLPTKAIEEESFRRRWWKKQSKTNSDSSQEDS